MFEDEPVTEYARLRVRVEVVADTRQFKEIAAVPEPPDTQPPLVMVMSTSCWHGDRWLFSTVSANVVGTVDTWSGRPLCDLAFTSHGFRFYDVDLTLMENGAGI